MHNVGDPLLHTVHSKVRGMSWNRQALYITSDLRHRLCDELVTVTYTHIKRHIEGQLNE